jgi:uncharacterized protein YecE (DUF72 family)
VSKNDGASPGKIRIGTSGWMYKHWREVFYPAKLPVKNWLNYYFQFFDTVEVNNTFYHLLPEQTFAAWAQKAPADFLYAIKANRYLTHVKKLRDPEQPLARLFAGIRQLKNHAGPILYQLSPNWHCDPKRLEYFLRQLPRPWRHVLEFRHPSWCHKDIRSLLVKNKVSWCIHDMRDSGCPAWVTGPLVYIRFHGPASAQSEECPGCYSSSHLEDWAERIRVYARWGLDVFAYFNNDSQGFAVKNALKLKSLLGLHTHQRAEEPAGHWW